MTAEQLQVGAVLVATMALFVWGRWRYDVVALLALIASVALGLVPARDAFAGFGHPAVVTVAAVLVLSFGLQNSGLIHHLARYLALTRRSRVAHISASCGLTAFLSAFMNNIGALALMLPVVLRNLRHASATPGMVLMPLAFASLLGGLVTLVGTPPNIVIATIRAEETGTAFGMFDFAPVGLPVAALGLVFVSVVGWRLLPRGGKSDEGARERFRIDDFIYQVTVPEGSRLIGARVHDLHALCNEAMTVMAVIRGRRRMVGPSASTRLEAEDILILEGDEEALRPLLESDGLVQLGAEAVDPELMRSPDVQLAEVVVMPGSFLLGASMRALGLHDRYGINLLAVARQGRPAMTRLGSVRFRVGDVLLLHGDRTTLAAVLPALRCLPLEGRGPTLHLGPKTWLPAAIFAVAVGLSAAGLLTPPVAFVTGAVALVVTNAVPLREAYDNIEWPVVVLLGALLPIAEALHATGATDLLAHWILGQAAAMPLALILAGLIAVSMLLSDLIHNSPTAVLMAPLALSIAGDLSLPPDPFLMAVAVGAASPYLTPLGHPSNTLVMAPGDYRFTDYWRMGLPLDALILTAAVPLIMAVWLP